nr:MAG: Putative metallopeptidase domain [Bacteriophage sp.]
MSFQKLLSKARIGLLSKDELVFFSSIILGVKHTIDNSTETAYTDGLNCFYNEEFFTSLTNDEREFLIAHEGMHIALEHCTSRSAGLDPKLWNDAADYVINGLLVGIGLKMPKGGLFNPDFHNLTTLQVYRLLEQDQQNQSSGGKPQVGGNQMGGKPMQDLREPAASDVKKREEIKQHAEELVMRGKTLTEMENKTPGNIGPELQRIIDRLTKPVIPWQRILQRFFTSMQKNDFTWARPNRRFISQDIYLPSMLSPALGPIDFAWDTSGSISNQIFQYFVSETYHVLKRFKPEYVNVMQFDHILRSRDKVRNMRDLLKLDMQGGGGTHVDEAIQAFAKSNSQALIVLTDGYVRTSHIPDPKKPVIWCVYQNKAFQPPWGQVVHFEMPEG